MGGASPTQGAPVLNCPGCGTKVADGTSICPSCDYIIDSSFISTDAPQDTGDDAQAAPPPPRRQTASRPAVRTNPGARGGTGSRPAVRTATGPARPRTPTSSGRPAVPAPAPALADEDATNIRPMEDILRNAPQRSTGARAATGSRPAARPGGANARPAPAPAPRRPAETELDPADVNYVPTRDLPTPQHRHRNRRPRAGHRGLPRLHGRARPLRQDRLRGRAPSSSSRPSSPGRRRPPRGTSSA